MTKFFTAAFKICNLILEFTSTLAKLLTKIETISVLFGIWSQNSPIINKAAHFAFGSVKDIINSKLIFCNKFKAVSLYFLIKSLATIMHSGIAYSFLLSNIFDIQLTQRSKLVSNL